jgi:hypothetical protein
MKNITIGSYLIILSVFLMGCQSDETLERDEITLKAVYQEYDVTYNMESKAVYAEAAFKTSETGSYVKLSGNDDVRFNVENSQTEGSLTLNMERVKLHWGSRNVPVYKGVLTLKSESNNKMTFNWYDSYTDQNIINTSKLIQPEVVSYSHNIEQELDTLSGDTFELSLREELTNSQTLEVSIYNKLGYESGALHYSFRGSENAKKKNFTISSSQLRSDSNSKEMRKITRKKKRFGNVELDVETEEIIPVLTSGRQEYAVQVKVLDVEEIPASGNKGGKLKKTINLPTHKMDIIF